MSRAVAWKGALFKSASVAGGQRGGPLIEVLVATFVAGSILLGFTAFFGWMSHVGQEVPSQLAIGREASFVINEMSRRVRPGKSTTVTRGTCKPTDPNSIGVSLPAPPYPQPVDYCFYKLGTQFMEDQTIAGTTTTFDLLLLSPTSLQVNTYTSCFNDAASCPGASAVLVTFQFECVGSVCKPDNGSDMQNTMTFTKTIYLRNN